MKTAAFKSYFNYTASQRNGIFLLLFIVVVLELLYFFVDFTSQEQLNPAKQQWLSLQTKIDSAKNEKKTYVPKIYPFNPNFITDYKGYRLGMTVEEIDRLLEFRKTNQYVNSAAEFQEVTKISDSLLKAISPYFKFPDWVKNKKEFKAYPKPTLDTKPRKEILDINMASREDLKKIYGIGDGLSERILNEKEKFGGFVSMDQMAFIWGLSPEVIEKLNQDFKVSKPPQVKKINVNTASLKELSQFPYFRYALAKAIVTQRSMKGEIKNIEDLTKIKDFPAEKVNIIVLYLEF